MTTGIFNERALDAIDSVSKAIKEEVDLIAENNKHNPYNKNAVSILRAILNTLNTHVQKTSINRATQGKLGGCPNWRCYANQVQ